MKVYAWVDGSVQPRNPGKISAGAAILIADTQPEQFMVASSWQSNGEKETNNRGEILGVINAIKGIKPETSCLLHIHSDSEHALEGLEKVKNKRQIFKTNTELWQTLLLELDRRPKLKILGWHVTGHSGLQYNDWAHWFSYASAFYKKNYYIERTPKKEEIYAFISTLRTDIRHHKKAQKKRA